MLLSVDSIRKIKAHSAMIFTLGIASIISGVTSKKLKKDITTTSEAPAPTSTSFKDVVKSIAEDTPNGASSTNINPVAAQDVTCTYDCCTVATILGVSSPDYRTVKGCCSYIDSKYQSSGLPGVFCTSEGAVTRILWRPPYLKFRGSIHPEIGNLIHLTELGNDLSGSKIPASIGNLKNLKILLLSNNSLSGPIPTSIGNLTNLQYLDLSNNLLTSYIPLETRKLINIKKVSYANNRLSGPILQPDLDYFIAVKNAEEADFSFNENLRGFLTFPCFFRTKVLAIGTNIILCGCVADNSPPVSFPLKGIPDECLAAGGFANSLRKRTLVNAATIGSYNYTCRLDENRNPLQDCLYLIYKLCSDKTGIQYCKEKVDEMMRKMSPWWQNVRKECGPWKWVGNVGNVYSEKCVNANRELQKNAYYVKHDLEGNEVKVYIPSSLTDSINKGFWSNPDLKE